MRHIRNYRHRPWPVSLSTTPWFCEVGTAAIPQISNPIISVRVCEHRSLSRTPAARQRRRLTDGRTPVSPDEVGARLHARVMHSGFTN